MHVSLADSLFAKELTICTSPETILIQIKYFFHVFHVSLILLSTDLMYSCVPGDQEGPLFSDLRKSFWWWFYVQVGILQFVSWIQICI